MFDAFCGMNLRRMQAFLTFAGTTVPYQTTCHIDGYRKGLIIVFTAEKPLFRVPKARKAWALMAVMVAAVAIRDYGGSSFGVDYVGLTDSEQDREGKIARVSAAFAEKLQVSVRDGKIDAAVAMEDLDRRLRLER